MIKKRVIKTLSQYVRYIEANCKKDITLFRGQRVDKSLLPNIARVRTKGLSFYDTEMRMFDEFKRKSIPFLEVRPDTHWDWLALAQHHGLATRLLDWTENPLAAMWFAVERPPVNEGPGVIWFFCPERREFAESLEKFPPFTITRIRVFQPNHVTKRIVAQGGWFTAHPYIEEEDRYVALNEDDSYKDKLTKLMIPPSAFSSLRRELDRCGVNSSFLFPGLDGLCLHIQWLNAYLEDEAETAD